MLGKLLKHEFRATSRVMGPLYLVLMGLSVLANFSIRIIYQSSGSDSIRPLNVLATILMVAFVIMLCVAAIAAIVLMINRFRQNLMRDEGYIMFTLPASVHGLIISKIIVSVVWFIATGIVDILAFCVASFKIDFVSETLKYLRALMEQINSYYALNGAAFFVEALVLIFLSGAALCLLFYASMAVGHAFANHKTAWSIGAFFGFQILSQFVGSLGIFNFFDNWEAPEQAMAAIHAVMGLSIVSVLIYCVVFYAITAFMLKKHLNLE